MLESTQKGGLDVTPWLEWFLGCLDRALDGSKTILAAVLEKAEFWKKHTVAKINDRQRDILNRLLDGFEGKLTSSKWALIEKCSPYTALRPSPGRWHRPGACGTGRNRMVILPFF
jgi:Fic family protein